MSGSVRGSGCNSPGLLGARGNSRPYRDLFLSQASFKLRQRAIGLFRYEVLDQISMRCKRKCFVAAKFGWADTACFALTLDEPSNGAQSQVVQLGNFSRVCPASIAARAHSRRSSEYGLAIHNWPPCPSGNVESDSRLLGNPSRFDLPGKCSSFAARSKCEEL